MDFSLQVHTSSIRITPHLRFLAVHKLQLCVFERRFFKFSSGMLVSSHVECRVDSRHLVSKVIVSGFTCVAGLLRCFAERRINFQFYEMCFMARFQPAAPRGARSSLLTTPGVEPGPLPPCRPTTDAPSRSCAS